MTFPDPSQMKRSHDWYPEEAISEPIKDGHKPMDSRGK